MLTSRKAAHRALRRYDLKRAFRSPGTWVLAAAVIIFAIASPLTAAYMPELMASLTSSDVAAALTQQIGEPSWQDANGQWVKNLSQIITLIVIGVGAADMSNALSGGDIPFVLTRGISRRGFLASKASAALVILVVCASAGGIVAWGVTRIEFDAGTLASAFGATLLWALEMALALAVGLLVGVFRPRVATIALGAFATYLAVTLGGNWTAGAKYSPLGIGNLVGAVGSGNWPGASAAWIIVTTAGFAIVLTATAVAVFERRDLRV